MTALSSTEICNLALNRAGSTKTITDLSDNTADARLCDRWYAFSLDYLLRQFPWNFAMRAVALAETDEDPMIGWAYQYVYPSDCAYARIVTDANGARQRWYPLIPGQLPIQWLQPKIPFQVSSIGGKRIILADQNEAYLVYTAKIADTTLFDETFTSALSWLMAMNLVVPLQMDQRFKRDAQQGYVFEVSNAFANSQNEGCQDAPAESPGVRIRY